MTMRRQGSSEFAKAVEEEFLRLTAMDNEVRVKEPRTVSLETEHVSKNRYMDVLPYDRNVFPHPSTKLYINASLIPKHLFRTPHEFIAAQAPLPEYFGDWWQAVRLSLTTNIVMLTQEVEGHFRKADRYWPEAVGETISFPGGRVTLVDETKDSDNLIITRTLHAEFQDSTSHKTEERIISHVQYVGWPDQGVPHDARSFIGLMRTVSEYGQQSPVVVHCSAGIGRTGTLISVYVAWQWMLSRSEQLGTLEKDSVYRIVSELKRSRFGMVQRKEQYAFVHQCVEFLHKCKSEKQQKQQTIM